MYVHVKEIIDQMSPEVLAEVEKAAKAKGVSIEEYVGDQLSVQIVEDDLVVDLESTGWDVSADSARGSVRGSVRGRF